MAIKLITTIQRWEGLSTDDKAPAEREGSTITEIDSGKVYKFQNGDWARDNSVPVSTKDYLDATAENRRLTEEVLLKLDTIIELKTEEV